MTYQEARIQEIAESIRKKTHRTLQFPETSCASEISTIPDPFFGSTLVKPVSMDTTNFDNALAAVRTAMSYWNAKNNGEVVFDYQDGAGPLKPTDSAGISAPVTNADGGAIIDCSGYIGLVLRGIAYLDSVYASVKGSSLTANPQNIVCASASWAERCFDAQISDEELVYSIKNGDKYRIITASDMAAFYHALGLTWLASGSIMPQAGDLCFFYKSNDDGALHYPNRFMGISHVGIMTGPKQYLNATSTSTTEGVILTRKSVREPFMYARPLYGCLTDGVNQTITNNKYDLLPGVWAGISQGESEAGGNKLEMNGKTLTVTTVGEQSGITKNFIDSYCPLWLPKGKYHLSGVVNDTGENTKSATHSVFGLRVYASDDLTVLGSANFSGVSGTTYASGDKSISVVRTPVWDIGGGSEFELAADSLIYISLYLGTASSLTGLSVTPVLKKIG